MPVSLINPDRTSIQYIDIAVDGICRRNASSRGVSSGGPGSSVGIATELRARQSGDRMPVGARFFAPVQIDPGAHPASCTMGTGSFPGVKNGRGVTLTPHLLLVPWSRKSRAIPLLPLWTVSSVQSLSTCRKVHCTRGKFDF